MRGRDNSDSKFDDEEFGRIKQERRFLDVTEHKLWSVILDIVISIVIWWHSCACIKHYRK